MLILDLKVGESIAIGSYATVTLEEKSGKIARLAIHADKDIPVSRVQHHNPVQIAASMGITGKA